MLFNKKIVELKNGKKAILRSPKIEDSDQMIKYLTTTAGETEFLARYPEERTYTIELEARYLNNIIEAEDCLMIVCEIDGEIAGNCQIVFMNTLKTEHRATVMIGLLKKYWSLGIGSYMFKEMIEIAKKQNIKQLELQVIEGNERGIALYQKYGFEIVAEIPNAYQLKDGSYRKEIHMIKQL